MDDRRPRARRIGAALVASLVLLSIGLADYLSGPEIAFSLFYLLVIALIAWWTGDMVLTVAGASVGGAIWLVSEWLSAGTTSPGVVLWNGLTRLVIFVAIGVLICRLKTALDDARNLARTDYVTAVLNARAFDEVAKIEVSRARRYRHPLTVTYVDIDGFKSVNDRYGHSQGDAVLQAVARTLRSSLRRSDRVARVGGDEFVVLLPETGYDQAKDVLAKLQQSLTSAMAQGKWPVTFSIGGAVFDVPPADIDALIKAADAMMYKAKADGKNCVRMSLERPAVEPPRARQGTSRTP